MTCRPFHGLRNSTRSRSLGLTPQALCFRLLRRLRTADASACFVGLEPAYTSARFAGLEPAYASARLAGLEPAYASACFVGLSGLCFRPLRRLRTGFMLPPASQA